MTVPRFHGTFCNSSSRAAAEAYYQRFVVHAGRNVARSSVGKDGRLDFSRRHVPLLFLAGDKDRLVPHSLNRKNASRYKTSDGIVDFKVFDGRDHFLIGSPGWEDVADYASNWLRSTVSPAP